MWCHGMILLILGLSFNWNGLPNVLFKDELLTCFTVHFIWFRPCKPGSSMNCWKCLAPWCSWTSKSGLQQGFCSCDTLIECWATMYWMLNARRSVFPCGRSNSLVIEIMVKFILLMKLSKSIHYVLPNINPEFRNAFNSIANCQILWWLHCVFYFALIHG